MSITLSTIVCVHNNEKTLKSTLQSIVEKHEIDDRDYECILVDDESSDNSSAICKDYCQMHSYFKYVRIFNDGTDTPSNAWNYGLKLCSGKYIHFLQPYHQLSGSFYKHSIKIFGATNADCLIRGYRINDNDVWRVFAPTSFKSGEFGPTLFSCIFKNYIKDLSFLPMTNSDMVFTWLALDGHTYYEDVYNYDSFVQYSGLDSTYKSTSELPYPNNIVATLQDYPSYKWMLKNDEIVQKYDSSQIKIMSTPLLKTDKLVPKKIIISNNCVAGAIYRELGIKHANPFLWGTLTYENFDKLLDEYDNIDFTKFRVHPTTLFNTLGKATVDSIFGVDIDNKLCIAYTHHKQDSSHKEVYRKGVDLLYSDMEHYIHALYQHRVKNMMELPDREPIFLFTRSSFYTLDEFFKIVYKPTKYKKFVVLDTGMSANPDKVPDNTYVISAPTQETTERARFLIKNYKWLLELETIKDNE